MQDFQRGLLEDLRGRTHELQERIAPALADPDRRAHAEDIDRALKRLDETVVRMQADPSLARPELDRQHRAIYERLNQNVFIIESYLVPSLERFSEHDRRLTRVVRKLGEQINWPMPTPLVVADSSQYYMTFPAFQLMKVPATEDASMLAYPDLVHEMTHILMTKERGRLTGDFVNVLSDYIADQRTKPGQTPLQPHLFEQWRSYWLEEFVCDMVAVYATGPSFGSQHIRLISGMPAKSFAYGKSHPPDEARVRAVSSVMRAMGNEQDAQNVEAMWRDYIPSTGEVKPAGYDRVVPQELIDALAARVVNGCKQLNLRAYDSPSVNRPDDIVGMVAEGWRRFRTNAAAFGTWQNARLSMLWQQLGLGGNSVQRDAPEPPAPIAPRQHPTVRRPVSTGTELAA